MSSRHARILAGSFLVAVAADAGAQAIVHPNQVRYDISFSNANPAILAELGRPAPIGSYLYMIDAASVDVAPPLHHHAQPYFPSRAGAEGEITVESSPSGIAYDVGFSVQSPSVGGFYHAPSVRSPAVLPEPADDVDVALSECAGMVRVLFRDADGDPVVLVGGSVVAHRVAGQGMLSPQAGQRRVEGVSEVNLLVRGDDTYVLVIQAQVGLDPLHDKLIYEDRLTLHVGCDEVVDATTACAGGGGGGAQGLGRMIGVADVLGEDENPETFPGYERTVVEAHDGPWDNGRLDHILSDPASGAFELENLMPSEVDGTPYELRASFSLGSGAYLQNLRLEGSASVAADQVLDLGDLFEVDPGRVQGDILLAGPPGLGAPMVPALSLTLGLDPVPPAEARAAFIGSVSFVEALFDGASTPLHWFDVDDHPSASAGFAGAFDAASAAFAGDYRLIVGGVRRGPSRCDLGRLKLRMRSDAAAPPLSFVDTFLGMADLDALDVPVAPSELVDRPIHACFGQLFVSFLSTSAPFSDPTLSAQDPRGEPNEWEGVDFEGRPVHRLVALYAKGTPGRNAPATTGLVVTTVPEGDYTLFPEVTTVNPGGGTTLTRMVPIELHVGCRDVVTMFPDFLLDATSLPPCTEPGVVMLEGQVRGGAEVARITWQVNAEAPQEWCASCGVDPTFAIPVAVGAGDVSVVVTAESADGRVASRRSFAQEAREPSALDRRPSATPLRVRREAGGLLELTWEDDGSGEVNAYRGTLASLHDARTYDHAGFGACDIAGGRLTTPAPSGSAYFLVGSSCGYGDSSLGRDSFGREHPPALYRCP